MADTIRTLAELNALFGDAVPNGAITQQELRDLIVSGLVNGGLGSINKPEITLGANWQTVDLATALAGDYGIAIDTVNKKLTFPCAMVAVVSCEVMFSGAAGQTYEFSVSKNGLAPAAVYTVSRTVADTSVHLLKWDTPQSFANGDYIQFVVKCPSQVFTLKRGQMRVQRIGVM